MDIIVNTCFLIAGFALLIKGADIFVDASVNIAKQLRVPGVVIGLTVVAFGTSVPEAVVSVSAALRGANSLAIGNVVGSNLFNLLMVIGFCAAVKPMVINFRDINRDYWISFGASAVLLIMLVIFDEYIPAYISAVLFVIFILYISILVYRALKSRIDDAKSSEWEDCKQAKPIWHSIIFALLGAGGIVAGGQLAVMGAVEIANILGMTQRVIGLTVVALGTSLPELVTSIVAMKKKQSNIAVGNVIGSNIFNVLLVLGLSGMIAPLAIDINLIYDFIILLGVNLLFLLFVNTGKHFSRIEGIIFVLIYLSYMTYTLVI